MTEHIGGRRAIRTGWIAISISIATALIVVLVAVIQLRDIRCTEMFSYTFAPFLVTCGARAASVLVLGWSLTIIVLGGFATAWISAAMCLIARKNNTPRKRFEAWAFTITMCAISTAIGAALWTYPKDRWADDASITIGTLTAFATLTICLVTRSALRMLIFRGRRAT